MLFLPLSITHITHSNATELEIHSDILLNENQKLNQLLESYKAIDFLFNSNTYAFKKREIEQHLKMGIRLYAAGKYKQAATAINYFLKNHHNPTSTQTQKAVYFLASCYFLSGELDAAINHYLEFLSFFDANSNDKDLLEKQKTTLNNLVIAINKDELFSILRNRWLKINQSLHSINVHPSNQPKKNYLLGLSYIRGTKTPKLEYLNGIIAQNQQDEYYSYLKSLININNSNYDAAVADLNQAMINAADDKFKNMISLTLARLHYTINDLRNSLYYYNNIDNESPYSKESKLELIYLHYELENYDVAERLLLETVENQEPATKKETLQNLLALIYLKSRNKKALSRLLSAEQRLISKTKQSIKDKISLYEILNKSENIAFLEKISDQRVEEAVRAIHKINELESRENKFEEELLNEAYIIYSSQLSILFPMISAKYSKIDSSSKKLIEIAIILGKQIINYTSTSNNKKEATKLGLLLDRLKKISTGRFRYNSNYSESAQYLDRMKQMEKISNLEQRYIGIKGRTKTKSKLLNRIFTLKLNFIETRRKFLKPEAYLPEIIASLKELDLVKETFSLIATSYPTTYLNKTYSQKSLLKKNIDLWFECHFTLQKSLTKIRLELKKNLENIYSNVTNLLKIASNTRKDIERLRLYIKSDIQENESQYKSIILSQLDQINIRNKKYLNDLSLYGSYDFNSNIEKAISEFESKRLRINEELKRMKLGI